MYNYQKYQNLMTHFDFKYTHGRYDYTIILYNNIVEEFISGKTDTYTPISESYIYYVCTALVNCNVNVILRHNNLDEDFLASCDGFRKFFKNIYKGPCI